MVTIEAMHRIGRLTLWLFIWPKGHWRSITHSHQKQLDRLTAGTTTPTKVAAHRTKDDVTAVIIMATLVFFLVVNLAHAL